MKQKLLKAIVATLILAVALSCGPGNGSKPYEGNSYIFITAPVTDASYSSNGASHYIELTFRIYEYKLKWNDSTASYEIDNSAPAVPVPNLKTEVCLELAKRTLQSYELESPRLYGDDSGEVLVGLGCIEFVSDFYGQVYPAVYVPNFFDGVLVVKGLTVSSSATTALNIDFDSGTSCTDGDDNDDDGYIDAADANCVTGYDNEGTGGGTGGDCFDAIDNDGDTLIDAADPGCTGPSDDSELGTTQCDNGSDDDGDTLIDSADPQCTGPTDNDESL